MAKSIDNFVIWSEGKIELDPNVIFDFKQNFGVPPELFSEWFNKEFPPQSHDRARIYCKAYDKANGTNFEDKFKTLVANGFQKT